MISGNYWAHLKAQARQPTIGQIVDDAMAGIERDNASLKAVLPKDYARPALDKERLGQLIDFISNIRVGDEASRRNYPTTLFAANEAEQGRCTARSTIYTANIAAGFLVHQFVRWLRGQPVDADTTLNLLASEIIVGHS